MENENKKQSPDFWRQSLSALLDVLIALIATFSSYVILFIFSIILSKETTLYFRLNLPFPLDSISVAAEILLGVSLIFLFFCWLSLSGRRTPGQMIMRCRCFETSKAFLARMIDFIIVFGITTAWFTVAFRYWVYQKAVGAILGLIIFSPEMFIIVRFLYFSIVRALFKETIGEMIPHSSHQTTKEQPKHADK